MPTYDYECARCGNRFELFQKMTDDPVARCPKCDGKAERLISAGSGIIFKGSGFYATDYKKRKSEEKPAVCPAKDSSNKCESCPLEKEKR